MQNDEETFDLSDSDDYQTDDHEKIENECLSSSNKKPRRRRTAFTQVRLFQILPTLLAIISLVFI